MADSEFIRKNIEPFSYQNVLSLLQALSSAVSKSLSNLSGCSPDTEGIHDKREMLCTISDFEAVIL
jgi:hypothetical protein